MFNDGLVEHLTAGGYVQSKWDQCLFVKWVSVSNFIYLQFHVDDFTTMGLNQTVIDEFHAHMALKYEVITNVDGMFLGIRDGYWPFTRPYQ